jgi:hypothetical protein
LRFVFDSVDVKTRRESAVDAKVSDLDQQIESIETFLRLARAAMDCARIQAENGFSVLEARLASLKGTRETLAKQGPTLTIQ